jgi:hypothetical protein
MRRVTAPRNGNSSPLTAQHQVGDALPIRDRFGVTVPIAALFIGISRTRVYELLQDGTLDGKVIHGRRIVLVESLMRMLGQAPTAKRQTVDQAAQ